jgi:hypothetical protein
LEVNITIKAIRIMGMDKKHNRRRLNRTSPIRFKARRLLASLGSLLPNRFANYSGVQNPVLFE